MKQNIQINKCFGLFLALSLGAVIWTSCKVEALKDPNNPGVVELSANPTAAEIQNLVTGIESAMRIDIGFYYDDVLVIGREIFRFSGSDPRLYVDLLGAGGSTLDDNTFYTTNPYAARYRVVKNTNILIEGLTNTTAGSISPAEKLVGLAYAKTIQAHELLMNFNLQYNNGIRVDVADPDNLGPFLDKDGSLSAIATLLDNAYTDLAANSGEALPFTSTLFGSTALTFAQFNRALAARVKVYQEDWAGALTAVNNSFLDFGGDLKTGAYYIFSTGGGDLLNPIYGPPNQAGEIRVAEPSFVPDAEAGDTRVLNNKVTLRNAPVTQSGTTLTSSYDFTLYKTNVDPIPIIRNEELILIYAEANIQLGGAGNITDAVDALNVVRNAASLPDYSGATTQAALIDEMLNQRRYSLYGEGHRWIDMRRYGRLDDLPKNDPDDTVWVEFPPPSNEHR